MQLEATQSWLRYLPQPALLELAANRMRELATQRATRRPAAPLLDWTREHRRFLIPDRPLDFVIHPFLPDIYTCAAPKTVVMKAGQMGASEYLLSKSLHACDQRAATVLYVFPTETHVSDFSSARLGPAIEASDYLAGIVVDGAGGAGNNGKRGADRVTLKRIRDRFIYFRGGKVNDRGMAPQLKSIDADVLMLDEFDEIDPRAPAIARKRLGHSQIAEEVAVSTPTYPGIGIHAEWQDCDQREWHVPCPACGERQTVDINRIVVEWDAMGRPVSWHGHADGRAWCACRKCGAELNHLAAGEWVAAYPSRSADAIGFHLTKLFSPAVRLLDLVRGLQTTDETKRREAFNQDLGVPYSPRGLRVGDDTLDACRRDYIHSTSSTSERLVAGIDVGGVLHCVIRAFDVETGERRQVWAGELDWESVKPTLDRFGVATAVIDALPETTKARELQAKCKPGMVWLSYYTSDTKAPEPVEFSDERGVALLDRTRTLDGTFALFLDGLNALPANIRNLPDYYAHLKASVRTVEKNAKGEAVARYVETGPDHYAHAENYCAAARFVNQTFMREPGWVTFARQERERMTTQALQGGDQNGR